MNIVFPTERIELKAGESINFNQVVGDLPAERISGSLPADQNSYDNTESGLDATNVQDALDELANKPSVDAYTKQESDEKYATKTELSAKADVSAIPTKTSDLQNDSGFVSSVNVPSYNLFNGEFSEVSGYYNGSGIVEASNYKMTKPIFLTAGNYYYNLITLSYGGVAPYFARTNQAGTTFSQMLATATGYTLTTGGKTYDIYGFTITEPDYYLFNANTGNTETASSRYFMITNQLDGVPDRYVPYEVVKKVENNVLLNDDMIEEIRSLSDVNPLFKNKIAVDGDSICYGVGYTGGYAKIISDKNEMPYENLAIGGATIVAETYASGGAARHWICRSMQNLSTDAKYLLLEGGVNDSSLGVTLGSLSSGYTATLDDTTFYGALETIFKTLVTKFVGKKYGFIIPHRMTSGMYPNGNYYNAIMDCATKWGVPVLDLAKTIPPFNSFRNTEAYDIIRNAYTDNGDGWHPTKKCYDEYYAPQIEAFLKSL